MNGGYIMIKASDADIYLEASRALTIGKPILFYENDTTCYYIDTITLDGTNVVLTKGGKTITIANDNTITTSGDIQNHFYEVLIEDAYIDIDGDTEQFTRGNWVFNVSSDNMNVVDDFINNFDNTKTPEENYELLYNLLKAVGTIKILAFDGDSYGANGSFYIKNNTIKNTYNNEGTFRDRTLDNTIVYTDQSLNIYTKTQLF